MKQTALLFLLATIAFAACTNESLESQSTEFVMTCQTAEPDTGSIITATVWDKVPIQKSFFAPWSGDKQDETEFQCYLSPHYFYFKFQVPDQTITLQEPFLKKLDVCNEDRAEIFLSATPGMETYYCMEIDPAGRALDYVTHYYRQFDYDWHSGITASGKPHKGGYRVDVEFPKSFLEELGVLQEDGSVILGLYRAEAVTPDNINWYSLVDPQTPEPDFHVPATLFRY